MVKLFDSSVRFITRGVPISEEKVRGTLKGLEYLRQRDYKTYCELVDIRVSDYRQLNLDNCL